jgi:hypothetical protein
MLITGLKIGKAHRSDYRKAAGIGATAQTLIVRFRVLG